jgi:Carboxypeptidase regulatory-like domain
LPQRKTAAKSPEPCRIPPGGATVTVTNTGTNQARKVTTSAAGNYSVPYLNPGIYDVTAENPGFKLDLRKGVQVEVGATARVDFTMQVGEISQQVESLAALLWSTPTMPP